MSRYHTLGKIPRKRHTTFKKEDGSLYQEELFGTAGFAGMSSLLYHIHPPTVVTEIKNKGAVAPKIGIEKNMKALSFKGFSLEPEKDFLSSRKTLFVNNDLHIGLAAPKEFSKDYFYKNGDADEMLFIHVGSGTLRTNYGNIPFEYGDYLIIPKGVIYQIDFDTEDNRILYVESFDPIFTPKRYRNNFGQLLEHSPFCERDMKLPNNLETHDEKGAFLVKIKKQGIMWEYVYGNHPFDVVGWDGFHYPYAFSIHDFEPITGRIHMPPPIHQTWESSGFVVCSFVPRLYDYHPNSIPAPYHHSNIDSEELLYYVDGDFMSRNNIEKGQITLHPGGVPHGPHPGAIEKSIGKKETGELAVMIDPFKPMSITEDALKLQVEDYHKSWVL
ncbi:homogentisate 1,2-dioxygenase [Tenacibaculum maritimum]|uniref:homogentisate 1,2-dioxygenase n=1 Tax=Tenacibaculum maritimum TaxID=107401 RepID=UPI0012E68FD1|nr:homogentisate 1,2-dioxygenase [Tenacibaculum maritimum]MCD9581275.1 homogentisate 1,2-dioxygenase [Tenacibaculum maritimum]MCD9634610.1 homogentisate 1,2-dioxygenase [Tenacibaculum maritimum]CAA0216550.1 Homogentisate 1,2-dioxygenase [Tenacibaculum maritimum]CAA0234921.1 Homogentisate 1,2-dioxygenase [Tenacibaculum maritimum]